MLTVADVLDNLIFTTLRVNRYLGKQDTTFIVPDDVRFIWATGTGGGGGGNMDPYLDYGFKASGGGAGCYIYRQKIAVTPKEELTIHIAAGGKGATATTEPTPGEDTYILRKSDSQYVFIAPGGKNSRWAQGGTIPGRPGVNETADFPKIATSGSEGLQKYDGGNLWGQGGANPMGRSAAIPAYDFNGTSGYDLTSSGFGYGGGGMFLNYSYSGQVGDGGEGALIIEYFSSI